VRHPKSRGITTPTSILLRTADVIE